MIAYAYIKVQFYNWRLDNVSLYKSISIVIMKLTGAEPPVIQNYFIIIWRSYGRILFVHILEQGSWIGNEHISDIANDHIGCIRRLQMVWPIEDILSCFQNDVAHFIIQTLEPLLSSRVLMPRSLLSNYYT